MMPVESAQIGASTAVDGNGLLSERDLAEVLSAFNDVTGKLQATHEALRGEVSRLKHELKQANEQIERSRRLAALGEMAAGIAHEVRNPLGSIKLYARMLEQDLIDRPPERTIAEKIGSAVRGLDAVVGDVLAFSKEMNVRLEIVDAGELIQHAVEECVAGQDAAGLGQATSGTRARVHVNVLVHQDARQLECDSGLLHRAIVNVVRNALDAMRERSSVSPELTISAELKHIEDAGGGHASAWQMISIMDNGPGIAAEALPRIFNPFFTTRATGTGLGLAIVHRILDAHGGRVSVRNRAAHSQAGAPQTSGAIVEMMIPVQPIQRADHARTDRRNQ